MLKIHSLIVAVAMLATYVQSAQATPLFGYDRIIGQNPANITDTTKTYWASRFTIGSSDVDVNYINYFVSGDGTVSPTIAIFTSKSSGITGGKEPDALLPDSLVSFAANGDKTLATINFSSTLTLTALTDYWVVVQGTLDTSHYQPYSAQSSQFTAFGGAVATPQARLIANDGTSWASFSGASFLPYALGLDTSPSSVPEPGTGALTLLGFLALVGKRRHCQRIS